jgi:hypothetical protein
MRRRGNEQQYFVGLFNELATARQMADAAVARPPRQGGHASGPGRSGFLFKLFRLSLLVLLYRSDSDLCSRLSLQASSIISIEITMWAHFNGLYSMLAAIWRKFFVLDHALGLCSAYLNWNTGGFYACQEHLKISLLQQQCSYKGKFFLNAMI